MSDFPPIIPDDFVPARRSAQEKPAAEGEGRQSSAGFDAILGGFAPKKSSRSLPGPEESEGFSDHDPEKAAVAPAYPGGDTPEADRLLRALFDDARPEGTGEPKVMERADPDPSRLVEQAVPVIEVDIAGNQSALAPAIAHHLAAILDGAEPAPPETATAMGPRGQGGASEPWLVASRISGQEVMAAADRGRFDQSGRLELATSRVTRHETHFRPAFLSDSGSESQRHLTSEGRSGRNGPGAITGLRIGVPGAVGNTFATAGPIRSMGGDMGPVSRSGMTAGIMPSLAHGAGLLATDMLPGAAREAVAGFRVEQAAPLLRPEMAQAAGPLRVLHIQLQPAELGRIELRLRATDDGLEVHVEASRRETHTLLQQDRELIAGILRKIGHPVETVTVSIGERLAETAGNGGEGSGGRPDTTAGEAGADRSGRGRDAAMMENRETSGAEDDQDPPVLAVRHRDSLYL